MNAANPLHAALVADFLPRYRGTLAVLLHRARRYGAACRPPLSAGVVCTVAGNHPLRWVRRIALVDAARRLYRLYDRWAALGIFPPVDPDGPELPLLHATVELAAAERAGDATGRRRGVRRLCRAARVYAGKGSGVRGEGSE